MKKETGRAPCMRNLTSIVFAFALLIGLAAPAGAATLYVGPTNDYLTIQAAVTAATIGDTIKVEAGTYRESITINKALTITGDRGDITVAGPGLNAPILDGSTLGGNKWGFKITASDVVIEGFEIRNYPGTGENPTDADGIQCWDAASSRITIRDNYIHHMGYAGVLAGNGWGGAQGLHANWTVSYNVISDCDAYPLDLENIKDSTIAYNTITQLSGNYGVNIIALATENAAAIVANNITVKYNTINGGSGSCINLFSWTENSTATAELRDVVVADNTITANNNLIIAWQYAGAGIASIRNVSIKDNVLTVTNPCASYYAVYLSDVGGVSKMNRNVLSLTGIMPPEVTWFHGINIAGNATGAWTLEANQLNGNGLGAGNVGIRVRSTLPAASSLTLIRNILTGFAKGISADTLATGLGFNAHLNIISGNSQVGIANGAGAIIDARSNWWGSASGPGSVGTGTGDKVSTNVTYIPWLRSSNLPKPDFAITDAAGDIVPWAPAPVGQLAGHLTVGNTGSAAGDAGRLTYWADWDGTLAQVLSNPNGDGHVDVGILAPGASITYDITGLSPASTYGTHTLLFFVDSEQDCDESSEGNNYVRCTYHFTGDPSNYKNKPDFAVTNITLDPASPLPGSTFTAYVTVVNKGSTNGNAGTLSVWTSHPSAATNGELGNASCVVGSLASGESATKTFAGLTAPALANGKTHHFRAFIDSANGTAETSEGNNQKTLTYHY